MKRWNIINSLIEKFNYDIYLEIGTQHGKCLENVNCSVKIGVDPNPASDCKPFCNLFYKRRSDEFFALNKQTFDIIFIDGLHQSRQVYKDINNSLRFLNKNGTIVLHDCKPRGYKEQLVPRETKDWNGDVWKTFVKLRSVRDDLECFTVDTDEGCGIIRKTRKKQKLITPTETYRIFEKDLKYYLNLITVEEFKQWCL